MPGQENKYISLFLRIILTAIGFILSIALLLLLIRLFFGLLSYIPWVTYLYMIGILLVPSALFISIYLLYFSRTKHHPSVAVRYISKVYFIAALACWLFVLARDLNEFFSESYNTIDKYYSYELTFLAANVGGIFLIGIIQALTTAKEKDWMDRESGE